jgi:hypothetical protein
MIAAGTVMIGESSYWKEPLLRTTKRLRRFKTATSELTERQLANIERDIFIGFFSVRKLFGASTKVTDATRLLKVQLLWYPNLSEVNWRNNHRIDELYDFNQKHYETRDVQFIAGRIIHSFIYIPYGDEQGGIEGIFFTSDIDRNKKLYEMTIDDVITIFEQVGNDYPTDIHWCKNPDGTETMTIS